MLRPLDNIECRVLGCLAEKELATPDYYPLSLNSLTSACNQKSNRDPVMDLDEAAVQGALDSLLHLGLATRSSEGGRVPKFCHNLEGKLHLDPPELSVLAELLLRGPQTPGELRQRAGRMHPFATLEEIDGVLSELMERDMPLVARLPRQPGRKEHRFAQLLGEEPNPEEVDHSTSQPRGEQEDRLTTLEEQVAGLQEELLNLRESFAEFRKQFE